ncbi:RNA polymerase sigma factor [Caproiciproducens galactitolivorans]|uniref:RNA polymerase sigma factor n=1 Tax=Caproiciproducens galactitolivorans TaxID=642589 RepID=UPI00240A529F|nr:sigma-70 family RNA polymerase sigma factor [Caproiciproducens galactitolivorans]
MENAGEKLDLLKKYILSDQDKFYRLVYSYTKNSNDTADVVQEAICKAIEKVHTLKNPEYVKTWLYRILINESINHIRKSGKNLSTEDVPESTASYEDDDFAQNCMVYDAVTALDPKLRTVIILRFYEGMKLSEIAQVTNSNLNSVKSRLYKALKLMKATIGSENYE